MLGVPILLVTVAAARRGSIEKVKLARRQSVNNQFARCCPRTCGVDHAKSKSQEAGVEGGPETTAKGARAEGCVGRDAKSHVATKHRCANNSEGDE